MKEFRITWAFVPMRYNPTRVSFVTAASPQDAEGILKDHIERTEGQAMGVYTVDLAPLVPQGAVK